MSGESRVLVAVPGLGVLALDPGVYRTALAEGARLAGTQGTAAPAADEPLLDAEQLADALRLPITWVEQAAREERIPSIKAGRWRRFKRAAVEAALAANGRSGSA
jgi:excisionase family DNA binding protein